MITVNMVFSVCLLCFNSHSVALICKFLVVDSDLILSTTNYCSTQELCLTKIILATITLSIQKLNYCPTQVALICRCVISDCNSILSKTKLVVDVSIGIDCKLLVRDSNLVLPIAKLLPYASRA